MAFHVAAVVEAGERVGDRHLDRLLHVVAQPLGVALLADLRAHARHAARSCRSAASDSRSRRSRARASAARCPRRRRSPGSARCACGRASGPGCTAAARRSSPAPSDTIMQVVVALGGVEQRLVRIGLDVDACARSASMRGDPLVRRRAVVDDQHAAAAAGVGDRLALRDRRCRSRARSRARMRSSSVIILSRASERTRAISATSDTGLVRKSSAPASSPCTRSDGWSSAVTITTGM